MFRNRRPLTLAGAERLIDDYLAHTQDLSVEEIAIFYSIQNRCRAIGNQRGWLAQGSCLTDYWVRQSKSDDFKREKITQKKLINEAKKIHLDTVNYTIFALKKLKEEIENNQFNLAFFVKKEREEKKMEAGSSLDNQLFKKKHQSILSDILVCLESVLVEITSNRIKIVSDREHWGITDEEEEFFQCERDEFRLAENLCAVYYPFTQRLDPLRGKIKKEKNNKKEGKKSEKNNRVLPFFGACYGHVLLATQEIEKNGKSLLLPRYDKETLIKFWLHDANHDEVQFPTVGTKIINWDVLEDKFKQTENIANQIEDLFSVIVSDFHKVFIYGVSIKKPHEMGHFTQIRYISFTQQIEYNDSNLGVFIFPAIDIFKYWFSQHILNYLPLNTILTISLIKLGVQPQNASASIPTFAINSSEKKYITQDDYTSYDILRENIYTNIQLIAAHDELKKTATMNEIHYLIMEHNKYVIRPSYVLLPALLKKINAQCEKTNTSKSGRFFKWRSAMANEFYIILKELKNPRDKKLLMNVDNNLRNFIEKYKIKECPDQKKEAYVVRTFVS